MHQFRFLANAAHHAFVRYRIAIGKRLDADWRSVVIVRKLDASLVSINKESVDGLIRGIAPNPRNHNAVFGLARKSNRVFAWVEPREIVYLQVEISDGSRKKRNKVEHMRIALEEMATPGNLRANTPRLFRLGKHLFGGLALSANNLNAANSADLARIKHLLKLAVAWHSATIMSHKATLPRPLKRGLYLLRLAP